MAVVFSRQQGSTRYEIRTAGRSVRLYTNRILHTQYHPERLVTGGVWDLLALPALALPQVRRVLLLGVGGGAAIHLLRAWCPGVHVTGVELNPMHLQLARRYFELRGRDIHLVKADARDFVEQYQGERFDLVIEDIFSGRNGMPDRVFAADRHWCRVLGRLVNAEGALVLNTVSRQQLAASALVSDASVSKHWKSQLCLTMPAYANAVGAFFRQAVNPGGLRSVIRADARRAAQERNGQLRYRIRRLQP